MLMGESRSLGEFMAYMMTSHFIGLDKPGDHHPVLVLPPFMADDCMTLPLRWFLQSRGYQTFGWDLGKNLGRTKEMVEGLPRRLEEIYECTGRTVSLVGWSAGGIFARDLARTHGDMVRQVISLGSPFRIRPGDRTNASLMYELVMDKQVALSPEARQPEHDRTALDVPATAVYSKTDGVAHWATCIEQEGPRRESVEVLGSHTGMGHNPAVLLVVADRLAQSEGSWAPFKAPRCAMHYYPEPVYWVPPPVLHGPSDWSEHSWSDVA